MFKKSLKTGTTLIEITLYFAILGVFLISAMTFAIQILNTTSLSSNFYELQSNLDFITQKMTYTIQTAESVDGTNSVFDSNEGALSLNMDDPDQSPTIFYFSDGNIFIQEGTADPIQLNSEWIAFNSLRFQQVSYSKAPDQIIINGTLSPKNTDFSNLTPTFTLHLSVSLRQ